MGSMKRTRNRKAVADYEFFKETIKAAIGAAVDSAIVHRVQILLLARIGCKIYAGPHEERINNDIMTLYREVLRETPSRGPALSPLSPTAPLQMTLPRFSYFTHIEVVSKGVSSVPWASRAFSLPEALRSDTTLSEQLEAET
jgi:hypothetical protein